MKLQGGSEIWMKMRRKGGLGGRMLGGGGLVEGVWHVLASLRVHTYIIHKSTKQRDCNKGPFFLS